MHQGAPDGAAAVGGGRWGGGWAWITTQTEKPQEATGPETSDVNPSLWAAQRRAARGGGGVGCHIQTATLAL